MLLKWYINISQELISWVKFYVPSRKIHLPSLKARCRLSISLSFCATILYRFETSSSFMRHIPQSFCSMRRKLKESEVSEPGVDDGDGSGVLNVVFGLIGARGDGRFCDKRWFDDVDGVDDLMTGMSAASVLSSTSSDSVDIFSAPDDGLSKPSRALSGKAMASALFWAAAMRAWDIFSLSSLAAEINRQ